MKQLTKKSKVSKNKILLPRALSYSGMTLWETDKARFIRKYFEGEDVDIKSKFIDFGKRFAEHLEGVKKSDDVVWTILKRRLPRYQKREFELQCVLSTIYGKLPMFAKLDTAKAILSGFREYKTGTIPWTQKRAEKHSQLFFYGLMIYELTKKIPDCHLDWIQTVNNENEIMPTGNIESFEVELTKSSLLKMRQRVIKNALEISDAYKKFLKTL